MLASEPPGRPIFARFAAPHTFSSDLSLGHALVAIGGALSRIFGTCVLFAVAGGGAAFLWSAIPSHLMRNVAVALVVLAFLAAMGGLLLAVSAVERRLSSRD